MERDGRKLGEKENKNKKDSEKEGRKERASRTMMDKGEE